MKSLRHAAGPRDLLNSIEKGAGRDYSFVFYKQNLNFQQSRCGDPSKDECEIDLLRENLIKLGIFCCVIERFFFITSVGINGRNGD